ncbi:hypothetical protein E8E14_008587 [Neopestalotiopsis sp. 37M]|nr:hypothetical protein E8E14_008587 [Neopestalotiopsis sp. 37M]
MISAPKLSQLSRKKSRSLQSSFIVNLNFDGEDIAAYPNILSEPISALNIAYRQVNHRRMMDVSPTQASHNRNVNIWQFLDKATPIERPVGHSRSLIAEVVARDLQILRQITRTISQEQSVLRHVTISLERSYGRYKLWSDGNGVLRGELDEPLKESRILRRAVWKLIGRLSIFITKELVPLAESDTLDSDDALSGSNSPKMNKSSPEEEIAEDLMYLTSSLADLGPLIDSPPLDHADFKSVAAQRKMVTPSESSVTPSESSEKENLAQPTDHAHLKFEDARGRRFRIPIDLCRSMKEMEQLINQAFLEYGPMKKCVRASHYDLLLDDGKVIPSWMWDQAVASNRPIKMVMWTEQRIHPTQQPQNHVQAPQSDSLLARSPGTNYVYANKPKSISDTRDRAHATDILPNLSSNSPILTMSLSELVDAHEMDEFPYLREDYPLLDRFLSNVARQRGRRTREPPRPRRRWRRLEDDLRDRQIERDFMDITSEQLSLENRYNCNLCDVNFWNSKDLERHCENAHNTSASPTSRTAS